MEFTPLACRWLNTLVMNCRPTRGLGTRWSNQARTSSSRPLRS